MSAGALLEDLRRKDIRLEADRNMEGADRRGLIIRWSERPTWIELRDPTSGEGHEVRASECLPGVVEAANRRSRKGGAA